MVEVALKEPKLRRHFKLGAKHPLSARATELCDLRDAIEHQQGRHRKLCITRTKQLATTRREQVLVFITRLSFTHLGIQISNRLYYRFVFVKRSPNGGRQLDDMQGAFRFTSFE